jgi:hypothetical protein
MVWKLIFAFEGGPAAVFLGVGNFALLRTQQRVADYMALVQQGHAFPLEVAATWHETPAQPVSNDAWFAELFDHVLDEIHVHVPSAAAHRIEGTDWIRVSSPQTMFEVTSQVYATLRHRFNHAGNANSNNNNRNSSRNNSNNSNSNSNSNNNDSANNAQAALQRLRQMPAMDPSRSVVTAPAAGGGRRSRKKDKSYRKKDNRKSRRMHKKRTRQGALYA